MLALIAPSFHRASETFVIDHVHTLAPGRTVLVCQDSTGAEQHGCPVLSHVRADPVDFGGADRLRNALLERWRLWAGPGASRDDRMRMIAFFRAQKVEVVLAEFGYSGVLVGDVCARLGLPLHVYFRGNDASSAFLRHPALRRRYRRMFGQARGIFCVARALADRLVAIGCPEDLIHVNPSGVDPDRFPPGTPEPGRMIAVGRLVDKKAPHLTLRAFAQVAPRFPDARLDIVGEGPLRARCAEVVAAHGLADRVTLHGARPHAEVAALMARAAVFVQHSVTGARGETEGFPTAIAEAMASQLPVVATRHSGIPEHVREGESGLLVDEGDVDAMAAAMAQLLADPARAAAMGRAARRHALVHLDRERSRQRVRDLLGLPAPG